MHRAVCAGGLVWEQGAIGHTDLRVLPYLCTVGAKISIHAMIVQAIQPDHRRNSFQLAFRAVLAGI